MIDHGIESLAAELSPAQREQLMLITQRLNVQVSLAEQKATDNLKAAQKLNRELNQVYARLATEKLRADQMSRQHSMQAAMHIEARRQALAG